jgi:hypothetical protein
MAPTSLSSAWPETASAAQDTGPFPYLPGGSVSAIKA